MNWLHGYSERKSQCPILNVDQLWQSLCLSVCLFSPPPFCGNHTPSFWGTHLPLHVLGVLEELMSQQPGLRPQGTIAPTEPVCLRLGRRGWSSRRCRLRWSAMLVVAKTTQVKEDKMQVRKMELTDQERVPAVSCAGLGWVLMRDSDLVHSILPPWPHGPQSSLKPGHLCLEIGLTV